MPVFLSRGLPLLFLLAMVPACGGERGAEARARPPHRPARTRGGPVPPMRPGPASRATSTRLGVKDKGVFGRFDKQVRLRIPAGVHKKHTSILVNKAKRVLVLLHRGVPLKVYPISLGFAPTGHKQRQGDGKTPEGRYFICEALHKNLARRYGARSLRLSYPNIADARSGLRRRLINRAQLSQIAGAIRAGRMPLQTTRLGSSIRIHGGGVGRDWTLGCIAMRDPDIIELYRYVRVGTPITVTASRTPRDRDRDGIPDQVDILLGGRKVALNRARYKSSYVRLRYPGGDVPSSIGVCTDVIIRAMRNAGFDLQVLLHRHIKANRRRYRWIKRPDRNIDHRRVKSLLPFFKASYRLVSKGITRANRHRYRPGDIVFLDTLPRAGPDHIGIVSDSVGKNGYPRVINNWTVGYRTQEMDLLPGVPVTHHFRVVPKKQTR